MFYHPSTNAGITTGIAAKKLHWSLSAVQKTIAGVITIDTPLTGGEWNS
jgi:hypothetical protein